MPTAFVAVIGGTTTATAATTTAALLAAGATAVLDWDELATDNPPDDDLPAVLFDATGLAGLSEAADLLAALSALAQVDGDAPSASGATGAVVVTTRQVTDTLKLVDAAGTLSRTADRDDHRFVGTPIAARLRLLRSVADAGPDPVAVLTALAVRGVTVIGTTG
jgi:hypothetical protein